MELEFASFLEDCDDIVSCAKNYLAVRFKFNDANRCATETMHNPRYPLERLQRIITVSLETMNSVFSFNSEPQAQAKCGNDACGLPLND